MPMQTKVCEAIIGSTATFPTQWGILGASWVELTGLALLGSLLMLALVYMLGNLLRNQQLLAWSKFELFQILATAVVVISSIAWVAGMCSFDMTFLDAAHYSDPAYYPPNPHMDDIIQNYFNQIEEVGGLIFYYLMSTIKWINFIAKALWTSNPMGIGSVDSPLESLAQVNSLFFFMMGGYVTSFLLLQLQMRMLNYMAVACIFYLYPLGIFFRAFEPTRAFGGTMIGLSLAMFLFYPIVLVFNDYLIWHQLYDPADPHAVKGELYGAIGTADANANKPNAQSLQQNPKQLDPNTAQGKTMRNGLVENTVSGVMFLFKPIMVYMIAAVVLPVINFIVVVEITRGLTAMFGEEIDVTNLTRLI